MVEDRARILARTEGAHAALFFLGFAIIVVVSFVPLLLDLGNLSNTYYYPKARALYILSPLVAAAVTVLGRRRPHLVERSILLPVGLFMASAVLATVLGVNPSWSLLGAPWRSEGLLTLLTYPIVLVGTFVLIRLGFLGVWITAILTGGTLVAAYGIAQYFGAEWLVRDSARAGWWEAFATTGHMNYLGAYMVLLLPLAIVAVLTARRRVVLALSGLAVVLMYFALLFTYSRAAWASAALMFVGLTILLVWSIRLDRRYTLILTTLGAITVTFLLPGGPLASRLEWATPPLGRAQSALAVDTPSVQARPYIWRTTLPLLVRRPLLGYGPEALTLVFPQEWDQEKQHYFGPRPMRIDKAHNDLLDTAMSIGVLGLAAYVWVILVSVRRGWAVFRSSSRNRLVGAATVVGVLAYWFDLQFGFSIVSVAPVFWSVLGAAAGLAPVPREA